MSSNSPLVRQVLRTFTISFALILAVPHPLFAQIVTICEEGPKTVGFNLANTNEIVAELDADSILRKIEAATSLAALAGINAQLVTLNSGLGLVAGSNTNAVAMNTQVMGKGIDALIAANHVSVMNKAQADAQVEAGAGNGAYGYVNACQQATLVSGATTMDNAQKYELSMYNGYIANADNLGPLLTPTNSPYQGISNGKACTTCGYASGGKPNGGGAGVIGAEFVKMDELTRKANIAKAATNFFGNAELAADGKPLPSDIASDQKTPATHLDVDPLSLSEKQTYSDTYQSAHDMLSIYLTGLPPVIIPANKSFTTASDGSLTSDYASKLVANREQLAYHNLTSMAMSKERAYHNAVKSEVGTPITAIFKAANFVSPTFQGYASPAALDQALYVEPANDPNYATNFAGMQNKQLLGFIATEMLLLNKIEYKRYLQEMEMYKIQSASLNLQARNFSFDNHP